MRAYETSSCVFKVESCIAKTNDFSAVFFYNECEKNVLMIPESSLTLVFACKGYGVGNVVKPHPVKKAMFHNHNRLLKSDCTTDFYQSTCHPLKVYMVSCHQRNLSDLGF